MTGMYARSTTIHGDPRSIEEGIGYVRDAVMPTVRRMDGWIGLSMLVSRKSGHCILTTSWRDQAALRSSQDGVRAAAERTVGILGGRPEIQDWEIAAMHRVHEAHHGVAARVTWLRTDPDSVNRAVDAVRLSLMPKLDDLVGFSSVSIMVRRNDGMTVAAVSYDSLADLELANEGARAFRDEFAPAMGIEVTETLNFDVAVAHLRVPETI